MRRRLFGFMLALAPLCFLISDAAAGPDECRSAIDEFNLTRSDAYAQLKSYAACLSDSDGHDDCSSEFSRIRSAQSDFELAVSEYESECQ